MQILLFLAYSVFVYWVVFMDGADTLEGWRSLFVFNWFAASLTAQELKFYAGISWIASLAILLFSLLGGT